MAHPNLVGKQFQDLYVLKKEGKDKYRNTLYKCGCWCGNYTIVRASTLVGNLVGDCGSCNYIERFPSEYMSWKGIKSRCTNPNDSGYKHYGALNVIFDISWGNFKQFLIDMGLKPNDEYEIERIDVFGNYEKENCIWIHYSKQNANKRNSLVNR